MPERCVAQVPALRGGPADGVRTYVIGVSHDSDASVHDVQRVLRKLRPTTVCLELPDRSAEDPMLTEYRRFVAGEGAFSVSRWHSLYRHGFRSAALERWLGERTDHFTEYRSALVRAAAAKHGGADGDDHAGLEMTVAVQEAAKLGATIERIDAPVEISSARAWNHKDIVSNLWGLGMRWWRTVPKVSCPEAWRVEPPAGWEEYRAGCDTLATAYDLRLPAERNRLALAVGGAGAGTHDGADAAPSKGEGARQIFEGADLRVWLYERDLILADNLYRVAVAAGQEGSSGTAKARGRTRSGSGRSKVKGRGSNSGSAERVVVGIVGLAHVPGVIANWGHQVDCGAKVGGLMSPKSKLPWQKRAMLSVAMLSVAATMFAANSWMANYREAGLRQSDGVDGPKRQGQMAATLVK